MIGQGKPHVLSRRSRRKNENALLTMELCRMVHFRNPNKVREELKIGRLKNDLWKPKVLTFLSELPDCISV